jgi:hypothetical protein
MPRSKVSVLTPLPAPQTQPPTVRRIPDDAVFLLGELQAVLGLPKHTLKREARLGRLRTARRAGRLWCTGHWVREWLESGEVRRRRPETSSAGPDRLADDA